jgi:hypothetical protein
MTQPAIPEIKCPSCARQTQLATGLCEWCGAALHPQQPPQQLVAQQPVTATDSLQQLRQLHARDHRLGAILNASAVGLYYVTVALAAHHMWPSFAATAHSLAGLFWGMVGLALLVGTITLLRGPVGPVVGMAMAILAVLKGSGRRSEPLPVLPWLPLLLGSCFLATAGSLLILRSRRTRNCEFCGGVMTLQSAGYLSRMDWWKRPVFSMSRWPRQYIYVCSACGQTAEIIK